MSRISRVVKNSLFVLPIIMCLFVFGNKQAVNANSFEKVKINSLVNQELTGRETNQIVSISSSNNLVNQQNKDSPKGSNVGFGFIIHNSFGVHIDGCYYQIEQIIDGVTGNLYCGTAIIFCQNSVEIYTGGSNCS